MFGVAAEGGGGLLWVAITLCDGSFVEEDGNREEEEARVDDKGGGEYGEIWDVPTGGDVGIRLWILSGEVFDSGKNLFVSGPNWSGAGGFEVYLWVGRTLSVEFELSGGDEGLVGGSEPAVEVDEDDSMTTGNAVVRGLE